LVEVDQQATVLLEQRLRMGDALAGLGRELASTDSDIATLESSRSRAPLTPPELP
jgi:hypothetical protein